MCNSLPTQLTVSARLSSPRRPKQRSPGGTLTAVSLPVCGILIAARRHASYPSFLGYLFIFDGGRGSKPIPGSPAALEGHQRSQSSWMTRARCEAMRSIRGFLVRTSGWHSKGNSDSGVVRAWKSGWLARAYLRPTIRKIIYSAALTACTPANGLCLKILINSPRTIFTADPAGLVAPKGHADIWKTTSASIENHGTGA